MTDFSKTNIHCSSIGAIMSGGRGRTNLQKWQDANDKVAEWRTKFDTLEEKKKEQASGKAILIKIDSWTVKANELYTTKDVEELSSGAKSHLKRVYGYAKYGKWCASSDKGTKYTNKGTLAEMDSINLISRLQGVQYEKNEERVSNDYLTGIPDVFLGKSIYEAEYVIDIKTSWDIETFLNNLNKPLCNSYWWQIQGYLAITGAKLGEVSYCLVDTPTSIINNELYKLKERMDVVTDEDPAYLIKQQELINNMTFGDMPESERRLRFYVERDDEAIQKVYRKVELCREYLNEIESLHLQGEFFAKEPEQEQDILEENTED